MRLTEVFENGIEMFQKVVTGCNAVCPNAMKIIKLGHSSPGQIVCGAV